MPPVALSTPLRWSQVRTLVLAGGGNRCWWQGGVLQHIQDRGWRWPRHWTATSAGASVAAACLSAGPQAALDACRRLYSANRELWLGQGLQRLKLHFAHRHIYPAWLESFVDERHFEGIRRSGVQLGVAVTQPARWLGLQGSVAAASVAYLLDKKLLHSIHPRLPRWLGLRQVFHTLGDCTSADAARRLLQAAAAALPFLPAQRVQGRWALDGGYVDNAPVPPQDAAERSSTLVLLSRHYPRLPALFQWHGRTYWQPSAPAPVSTWDCRQGVVAAVSATYELGRRDAQATFQAGHLLAA